MEDNDQDDARNCCSKFISSRKQDVFTYQAQKKRAELFSGVSINEDQPALIRTRSGMSRYIRNASRHNNGEPEETGMEALSAENDSEKDERSRNGLYLPEYDDPMCA